MKQAAIYIRSASKQQLENTKIENQRNALLQFAKDNGYEIPSQLIFEDNGVSGSLLVRPGMDRLRACAAEGFLNCIFILSPDRLSRKCAHQLIILAEFKQQGVQVLFKDHNDTYSELWGSL
jgi:site-specific DNA recombinase